MRHDDVIDKFTGVSDARVQSTLPVRESYRHRFSARRLLGGVSNYTNLQVFTSNTRTVIISLQPAPVYSPQHI